MSGRSFNPENSSTPERGALPRVLADELREISARLDGLAALLAGDALFASRYLSELQTFDYLIQHTNECALSLERFAAGEDARVIVDGIRLDAVQQRISAALGDV